MAFLMGCVILICYAVFALLVMVVGKQGVLGWLVLNIL